MADTLTTAQQAPLLADGNPVHINDATITFDPDGVAAIVSDSLGNAFVRASAAGTTTVAVVLGNRSGSDVVTVTEQPLAITLGTPELF